MANLVSRYAETLMKLSSEYGREESDLEQAIFIREVLNSPDARDFLRHPHIPDSEKQRFFRTLSENLSDYLMEVLFQMISKNQEAFIIPALDEYITLTNKRMGKMDAKVVSAKELSNEQIEAVRALIAKKTNMQVEIRVSVDPEIIGGFYIVMDGQIIDRTIRTQLSEMKESLKRGSIG